MPNRVSDETRRIMEILNANKQKSFVDRIINRQKYPALDIGNGEQATHLMSMAEQDGKYYVFPTVLWNGKGLVKYDRWQDAFDQVQQTGNFIEFDDPNEAEWFSRRYKAVWGE